MKPGTPTKIAGIAVNAFLVLVLLAQAFFLLAPRLTDLKFLTVIGGSMSPAIPLGAVIAVRPVDAAEIQVGDIIAYNSSDPARSTLRVVHRVVAIETDANGSLNFITRGDASGSEDIDVTSEANVIGRSWFSIPLLGYLWSYVRTPWLFILLVAVPGIAIIALEGAGLIAYLRRRQGPLPFPGQLGITAVPLARETPAGRVMFPATVRKGRLPRQGQKERALPQSKASLKGRSASPRATIHLPAMRERATALPQSK
ncbi:MAG: signal peptidase I, partial [Chloroflexi bacterium]|nr:signal peptidase I [Chloroflexota bacterium]